MAVPYHPITPLRCPLGPVDPLLHAPHLGRVEHAVPALPLPLALAGGVQGVDEGLVGLGVCVGVLLG